MAENHVLLETIQLSQTAASITFDNIPQTGYTDLKIVASVRSDYSGQAIALRINPNGSTANMTSQNLQGSGTGVSAFTDTIAYASANGNTSTSNTFNNVEWYIPNYTSSNAKSISVDYVTETNATAAISGLSAGLWNPGTQVAITSLVIITTSGSLLAGSTFSIYGIAATGTTPVTAPFATGGNIVANDGTYWYHAFLSSGTFTPFKALSCDVLVIAGGGGGGENNGGGGAGGLLYSASQSLTAINHFVTVGAGGAGYADPSDKAGDNGSNSQFGSITASVGGGGGGSSSNPAKNGGSGGGSTSGGTAIGLGTAGQGNNGGSGNGFQSGNFPGGGGGGAGAVGGTAPNNSTAGSGGVGAGGTGYANYLVLNGMATATNTGVLSSGHYYFAGGGGAGTFGGGTLGTGGTGGGGAANVSGTASTGGGGGGGKRSSNAGAGNGGSGIVIVRYTMV